MRELLRRVGRFWFDGLIHLGEIYEPTLIPHRRVLDDPSVAHWVIAMEEWRR